MGDGSGDNAIRTFYTVRNVSHRILSLVVDYYMPYLRSSWKKSESGNASKRQGGVPNYLCCARKIARLPVSTLRLVSVVDDR